ncbi:hypothetical protein Ccrd_024866 [Cynara cardunculus var. scolymus]|uniref:Uncharacterized protein n=1 Tax=Cynara cardunculus var. scolymus TaxID=59895 RepID=A0A103XBS9_CYNCS|nr:hypothetical protein Ccrd_024866 [Cynara cardunculus var. scolymus]
MESATDLSLQRIKLAKVSINSGQYPPQEIKTINPIAQTRCLNKSIHTQTDKLIILKGLYPLISCEEFNHK